MLLMSLPIGILLISALMYNSNISKSQKDKIFMAFCCTFVVLFIGLRSRYIGSVDTNTYVTMFENIRGIRLTTLLLNNDISSSNFIYSEGSFYIFSWILAQVFENGQAFILITTAIITLGVTNFIGKHSENLTFSWIAYICLGLMTFNMNGMRQAIAMSICLFAYDFAKQKKLIKFLLVVLLAFTFHKTSFVFLIVYPLANYKPTFAKNTLLGICGVAFLAQSQRLAAIYDNLVGGDYAEHVAFESGGFVNVAIYIIIIAISIFVSMKREEKDKDISSFIVFLVVGFIFYISRYLTIQIFERMSYYFNYFSLLLFPKMEKAFEKRSRLFYEIMAVVLSLLLFLYRIRSGAFANFNFF